MSNAYITGSGEAESPHGVITLLGVDMASCPDLSALVWFDHGGEWEEIAVPAASVGVIEQMTQTLGKQQFEVTSGSIIQKQHTSAPSGFNRIANDGERNGRLAWVPGA